MRTFLKLFLSSGCQNKPSRFGVLKMVNSIKYMATVKRFTKIVFAWDDGFKI